MPEHHWFRGTMDLAICFVAAVMMLRAFVLEGYLISTGSMAPGLLGFHRHIHCPSCQYEFAFGVSFDESVDHQVVIQEPEGSRRYATCPNCGQINIDVSGVPNSHGDQLLVQKHAYDLRSPRRWETVVFHNPASPGEAYVKRVVGLPGESIRIINGDVFVNGEIARKDYEQQKGMRIPVCNLKHLPHQDDWELPWDLDNAWQAVKGTLRVGVATGIWENRDKPDSASNNPSGETADGVPGSVGSPAENSSSGETHWIRFRNWRWFGGQHLSETPLVDEAASDWHSWASRVDMLPVVWTTRLQYDASRGVLQCRGVMPNDLQRDLLSHGSSPAFHAAVFRLAALSHLAPVTDRYGYNSMVASPEYIVSDLMLLTEFSWTRAPKSIAVDVPVDFETLRVVLEPATARVRIISTDDQSVLAESDSDVLRQLATDAVTRGQSDMITLEVSNIDHQVVVAINGRVVCGPLLIEGESGVDWTETEPETGSSTTVANLTQISLLAERQRRWAFGVTDGDVSVSDLQMFRDVFYTPGRRRNAIDADYQVPEQCYFVQGDNSPVSSDSRNWQQPAVPHRLLIGKPFLVHLPSRPAMIEFAGRRWPVRIPEFSRIRYIR